MRSHDYIQLQRLWGLTLLDLAENLAFARLGLFTLVGNSADLRGLADVTPCIATPNVAPDCVKTPESAILSGIQCAVSITEFTIARGHLQGANRHEAIQFPQRLDDYLTDNNPVRFMDAFGDALDLAARGFRHAVAAAPGRPSDHPGDLLKRSIDGYLYRLRSSRRLEQETQRNVELMWLLKQLRPDHQTIANFRRDPLESRREVCRAFTLLCKQLDLFGGELVAIDGSQFRAVNAKGRHFTKAKLAKVIAQIDARVAGYLTELEAADDHDEAGTPGGARAADLQTKIEALRGRRLRYEDLQAAVERSGHDQLSLTDPDSRAMKGGNGGGTAVCYHVQTAVDAQHKLSVACDVTNDPTARDWLSPLAVAAKEVRGGPFDAVADVGYDHGQEVKPCLQAGMTPSIARPITSANQTLGLFSTDAFT